MAKRPLTVSWLSAWWIDMSHNEATEIRLINKIVVHFAYLPTEEAVTEVANHVSRFWDPRMKRRLFELVDSETKDFEPVAVAAAALLR
ncbi:MAG: formate dehydrogenase subunit delta [Mycobacterium sp.]|nr:formate dehydrogenase subunit delta [Mycobacterium sp.]